MESTARSRFSKKTSEENSGVNSQYIQCQRDATCKSQLIPWRTGKRVGWYLNLLFLSFWHITFSLKVFHRNLNDASVWKDYPRNLSNPVPKYIWEYWNCVFVEIVNKSQPTPGDPVLPHFLTHTLHMCTNLHPILYTQTYNFPNYNISFVRFDTTIFQRRGVDGELCYLSFVLYLHSK